MDHAEEQAMELEALAAIYMDDFQRAVRLPDSHCDESRPRNKPGSFLRQDDETPTFELTLVPETGA